MNIETSNKLNKNLNTTLYLIVLPVITGILLAISAIPSQVWYLSFIALIPLLLASDWTLTRKRKLLIFSLQLAIALIVFYLIVGRWVLQTANASFLIGILLVLPFVLLVSPFILLKKRGIRYAPVYFIAAWLSAELIQSYFQLGSPFFNLGNNLGASPKLIQWYEFTGVAGGTLWILAVNFTLFILGKTLITERKLGMQKGITALGLLLIPMVLSLILFYSYKEKGRSSEVLIVHPSTDCNDVKYRMNIYELMDVYLGIMLPQLTDETEYVVLPETAITNAGWVADLNNNLVFDFFHQQTEGFPNLKLVTGAILYEAISNVEKIKGYEKIPGIRYSKNYKVWYYTYNAALLLEKNRPVQMRVKEGLVPYQEYAPYPKIIPRLPAVGIDFQFSSRKPNTTVFRAEDNSKIAALVCYELAFGNKFAKAARQGAEAFFVPLNEGWYLDQPQVPRQFLQLSVIRAIENRRSIAHTSNMGISAFISQRGEVVARTESKQPGFLKHELRMNKKRTFAALMGNYLGILALISTVLMIIRELVMKKISINK